MSTRERREISFLADRMVTHLQERIVTSPGDRSVLRRMVGHPPTHPTARPVHGVIYSCLRSPHGEPLDLPDGLAEEWAFYGVAALIAAQPRTARDEGTADEHTATDSEESEEQGDPRADGTTDEGSGPDDGQVPREKNARLNLGASLARGVRTGDLKADTTESRLHRLCRLDLAGIHKRLPALVRQARTHQVPVDWVVLIEDLARWSEERDTVAKEWLQSYHRTRNRDLYEVEKRKRQEGGDTASGNDEEQ
ncbi:type I-E CRISPR-associated protein Cse2/CasB [Nocardiopsis eucommiae]|uniref:type I-E CRISPR-associated protein Cse2/CasB n=1 Tax=Nocardiopsis eucommiae TaxID=2831970 RepID=UPI003D723A23